MEVWKRIVRFLRPTRPSPQPDPPNHPISPHLGRLEIPTEIILILQNILTSLRSYALPWPVKRSNVIVSPSLSTCLARSKASFCFSWKQMQPNITFAIFVSNFIHGMRTGLKILSVSVEISTPKIHTTVKWWTDSTCIHSVFLIPLPGLSWTGIFMAQPTAPVSMN